MVTKSRRITTDTSKETAPTAAATAGKRKRKSPSGDIIDTTTIKSNKKDHVGIVPPLLPPIKVPRKQYRKICSTNDCTRRAERGGLCKKHMEGGSSQYNKLCSSEGCTNYAQKGGVCVRHGAQITVKSCSIEGCTNQALSGQNLCMKHGGTVKLCSSTGCTRQAQNGGLCQKHEAKVKLCSTEGCKNQVKRAGLCWKHGAKNNAKLCNYKEGCQKMVQFRGGSM